MASSPNADVIDSVLRLVATWYVEPRRVDPGRMWEAAVRAAARWPGIEVAERAGARVLLSPGRSPYSLRRGVVDLDELGREMHDLASAVTAVSGSRSSALETLLAPMLRTLDRWSTAKTGGGRRRLRTRYAGVTNGVGVRIGRRDGVIRVLEIFEGSGARASGLAVGDRLVAVDAESIDDLKVAQVLARLRGAAGSSVPVIVEREEGGRRRRLELVVKRGEYESNRPEHRWIGDGVGVIRIKHFSRRVGAMVDRALIDLEVQTPLGGLIIDLQGNQGGSMLACAETADLFIDGGLLVQAPGRNGEPVEGLRPAVHASPGGRTEWPIIIVVDQRTASAAELFAATMAGRGRATLIGRRTFGKTTIQKMYEFPQVDLTVKLSTAYMWAAGARLPDAGLEPEIPASDGDALTQAARLLEDWTPTS